MGLQEKMRFFRLSELLFSVFIFIAFFFITPGSTVKGQEVFPILEFPTPGLDDTSTYRGYTTRFFRDSAGNTLQILLNHHSGRVVNLWADGANESISFTARTLSGKPASLNWHSPGAKTSQEGAKRYLEYSLSTEEAVLEIGHFILNSMRIERDFQYQQRHILPFDAEPFIPEELPALTGNLKKLPADVKARHLALLNAKSAGELRARLLPEIQSESQSAARISQPTFDGKNHLSLEIRVENKNAMIEVSPSKISLRSGEGEPLRITIRVGTDSPSLNPLSREEIFNQDFFKFYEKIKTEHDRALQESGSAAEKNGASDPRLRRFLRLERQVKSMELLCSREKLMAGLPNFATYFGRDMMMAALMLEPVWQPAMPERVIASVLKKLTPSGEVSHEEALGGQAIRENAAQYNRLIEQYLAPSDDQKNEEANQKLAEAEKILGNLQAVRENYHMMDDDFQLPVLTARYLSREDVGVEHKLSFLRTDAGRGDGMTRLALLLRNLEYVAQRAHAYAENPVAGNLVAFPRLDDNRWFSGSWRDSGPGYANGRFAMDINVVWVPGALEALGKIFDVLEAIGISETELTGTGGESVNSPLANYIRNREDLKGDIHTWRGVIDHFKVSFSAEEANQRIRRKLDWLPEDESRFWKNVLEKRAQNPDSIRFLALSLDENGRPIPVANTDPATWIFLGNFTREILAGTQKPENLLPWLGIFAIPYPAGLFLPGAGLVVANDAYAGKEVWENFRKDPYHSPRTIWGREVNLFILGLSKQIAAAYDAEGKLKDPSLEPYLQKLRNLRDQTLAAVESSGLKHNELWSYRVENGQLLPARYPTTSDIQLWNLTDLAVQFQLERISSKEKE